MSNQPPSSAKAVPAAADVNERPFLLDLAEMVDMLKHRLPCCPNCIEWDAKREVCLLTNPQIRPPAPVIAFGCAAFNQDVPF